MKKIAIASVWPLPQNLLTQIANVAPGYSLLDLSASPTDQELEQCEILFGNTSQWNRMPNLKWVHAQTAGVDVYINSGNSLPQDVLLTSSTGAYGISIGEHMLGVTLMLLRNLHGYVVQQQQNIWRGLPPATNLHGRNVLVIGMGDIGGRYAFLCNAMGATVNGVVRSARSTKPSYVNELQTMESLDKLLPPADIIALALPGTGDTHGVLSQERLALSKQGALIVNVGRGTAIDQNALIEYLQNGHIGGAALDVTNPEPLPQDSPLWQMDNVIITPHTSHGGRNNTAQFVVDKFIRYLQDYQNGTPFERVVDRVAGY